MTFQRTITPFALIAATTCCYSVLAQEKTKLTNQQVVLKVEHELEHDPVVDLNDVDITCHQYIVTLRGDVPSLICKDRATQVTGTVKGVRSIVNLLNVDTARAKSDIQLKADIHESLRDDATTESYQVDVAVEGGVVTLTGRVDSYQEKLMAQRVAMGVAGVRDVKNNLAVAAVKPRPAREIKADVESRLAWDVYVNADTIEVAVDDKGDVTLSGAVGTVNEQYAAETDAYVAGVRTVNTDKLKVAEWLDDADVRARHLVTRVDSEIEDAIKAAYLYDPRVKGADLTAASRLGYVTLRGTVTNARAKRAAQADAENTLGVRYVMNRIKVRPAQKFKNDVLAERVRLALLRNDAIDRFKIEVTSKEGVIHLRGDVDTFHERATADRIAASMSGVKDVKNHISVDSKSLYKSDPFVEFWDDPTDANYTYRPDYIEDSKSDKELKADVKSELWWSPYVDSSKIEVAVKRGEVRLTGTVSSIAEKKAARENAYQAGATWVNNDLAVGSK